MYEVVVGKFGDADSTNGFTKAVEVPYQLDCPLTLGKNLWKNGEQDTFSVAVDGMTVTVTRTDRATPWGMNLRFKCAIKGTAINHPILRSVFVSPCVLVNDEALNSNLNLALALAITIIP